MRTSNWFEMRNRKGSQREQSRRESNGTKHRETAQINAEIAGDAGFKPQPKFGKSVDTQDINRATIRTKLLQVNDAIRMSFGPRLVRPDGTAMYLFQVKR